MARIVRRPKKPDVMPPAEPIAPASLPKDDSTPTTLGDPTGTIGGPLKIAYGRGGSWADVNRWDTHFLTYGAKHGVLPQMLKAMAVIESGGQMIWNQGGSGAYGIMQIKPSIWGQRASALGYDLNTPAGQIGMAAAILGGDIAGVRGTTAEERFLSTYYPTAGLDVPGEDGHTPRQYLADMHELMRQIDAANGAPPPQPKPKKLTEADVLRLIAGVTAYVSFGFNQPNMSCGGPCRFYAYGVGHGTSADYMHTGDDISVPRGTTLRTPLAGRVTCVGTQGEVTWDQGCGAFGDTAGGIGNVTVLTDAGPKLTFGHCSKSLVAYNQRVEAGQPVALSGTNRADHLHLDVVTKRNGSYFLNDPLPTLVAVMAGAGGPLPTVYADAVDIPQPDDTPPYVVVKAVRETPVLLRGNPDGPKILPDLPAGETFFAQHKVLGVDGRWYWVGRLRGRVAENDTDVVETVLT